ncbi:MAG TPA: alpha/beta hydrolase [Solirubrobacteraceae bacterium]|jgi:pimeloyl-ACP methyl ester carboxylesterase
MTQAPRRARRAYLVVALLAVTAVVASPARAATPALDWKPCADAAGFQCATATVPRDYSDAKGAQIKLAVVRLPAQDTAHRIGSLFVNFGGPGGPAVEVIKAIGAGLFGNLNQRLDIVGFDPRGVGESSPSIDCKINQETAGIWAQPFVTPENLDEAALVARTRDYIDRCIALNGDILPFVSTANVARDMDALRQAVGDDKLTYLGFSYGTFLGATYASMFPHRYRALVLDGALDADAYINRPLFTAREQTEGFERALGRFMQACAVHQDVCRFGGEDPWNALDELIERAEQTPIAASGDDPRPITGDDIRAAAIQAVYAKQLWPLLAISLSLADAGDGVGIRLIVDFFYGRLPDGTFDPLADRFFSISALELQYPRDVGTFLDAGLNSWGMFEHFWWNAGYGELPWGLYTVRPRGIYTGPFQTASDSPTILVVGTTYDPATPYRGARKLVRELGTARLLTMRGDGHTAYGGNSECIDAAVDGYLLDGTLPPAGTVCRQQVPFAFPPLSQARALSTGKEHRFNRVLSRILRSGVD